MTSVDEENYPFNVKVAKESDRYFLIEENLWTEGESTAQYHLPNNSITSKSMYLEILSLELLQVFIRTALVRD